MKLTKLLFAIPVIGLVISCGAVKDEATEIKNDLNLPGHWLMTESEHSSRVEKLIENESVVLTFKDSKAAFSPTDTVKGKTVFGLLSRCNTEVRPYKTDGNQLVFEAIAGCEEKRTTVEMLDENRLKFGDPESPDIIRTFRRISNENYNTLVKPSDRRP